ncbi:MAG TPA: 1,4-dihydroxy-2-naphthoate polyprenyltransferase, partial [Gammaproteobacteria bacterium]|nr:1,4-dihydroxy-2-naphthoate polyprenyltransferase [Gammaproteobacteria bacterium]
AVLLVNNYRDLDTDILANKLTLAYALGRKNSRRLYATLVLAPFGLPLLLAGTDRGGWAVLAALPLALWLVRRFTVETAGAEFNRILAHTAQLQLIYALLLCIGLAAVN